jgi:hypothetical protein
MILIKSSLFVVKRNLWYRKSRLCNYQLWYGTKSKCRKKSQSFKDQMSNYSLLWIPIWIKEKILQEGFNVTYPMESYRSYRLFSLMPILIQRRSSYIIKKNTTQYYNQAFVKDHNFVMNPDITERQFKLLRYHTESNLEKINCRKH